MQRPFAPQLSLEDDPISRLALGELQSRELSAAALEGG